MKFEEEGRKELVVVVQEEKMTEEEYTNREKGNVYSYGNIHSFSILMRQLRVLS